MLDKNIFRPNIDFHLVNKSIKAVVDIFFLQAKLQKVKIKFVPLTDEVSIKLDVLRAQQVVINLISNALKFSKVNDKIEIKILLIPGMGV